MLGLSGFMEVVFDSPLFPFLFHLLLLFFVVLFLLLVLFVRHCLFYPALHMPAVCWCPLN